MGAKLKKICLAGGCFWGTEAFMRKFPGVISTEVGYANSIVKKPSYQLVCTGATKAAEAVMVEYDPDIIALPLLLDGYSRSIDPTLLNRQGYDCGTQYRTGIYWLDEADAPAVHDFLELLQTRYDADVVVEASALENFYPAETYHQRYLEKNPDGYCHVNLGIANRFIKDHMGA